MTTTDAATSVRGRREWITFFALIAAVTFVWAVWCVFVLDLPTLSGHALPWWASPAVHPGETFVSVLVVWAAILLLVCVSNRLWLSLALALGLCVLVAFANAMKLRVREEPLYPSDLYFLWQPGFLLDMASPGSLAVAALGVSALVVVLVLVGRRVARRVPPVRRSSEPRAWPRILVLRVVVAVAALIVLIQATQFNEPDNRIRAAYQASGAELLDWRQANNYFENGFLAGFLYNTLTEAMKRPNGYSEAAMEEIADRYGARSAQLNAGSESDVLADVNVILLLSESFSDPDHLDGVDLATDPIPHTRETMARQPSGQVFSNTFGGGTANMEFEALTGMSQALFTPQLTTPFQMLVPKYDRFPSVARYFSAHGHQTLGVHPFNKNMFRRSEVYPRLGFERFLDQTRLDGLSPVGESSYASDESTFREAGRLLKSSDEPQFMSLVTMQNHYPYDGRYVDPIGNNLHSAVLGQYARGLAHSDQATDQFLEDLKRSREKTLVIFYGDHLPGIYDAKVMGANSIERLRETPFFIWSSYEQLPATQFPVTSPMYFMPLAFEAAGARVPPYFALLLDLHAEVPVLNGAAPLKPDLSQRARGLLRDLQLVQYDFSVGKRYVAEEMFYAAR